MKRNVMMRLASFLLVAVLISTSAISGTYAKYTTQDSGSDEARVAKWGVELQVVGDLYGRNYKTTENTKTEATTGISVQANADDKNVVAPGTKHDGTGFNFALNGKPEVSVEVTTIVKAQNIFLNAGTYGLMVKVKENVVTSENFAALNLEGLYTKSGTTYSKATAFDSSAIYYTLEDQVQFSDNYYPVVYSLAGSTNYGGACTDNTLNEIAKAIAGAVNTTYTADDSATDTTVVYTATNTYIPNTFLADAVMLGNETLTWEWAFDNDGCGLQGDDAGNFCKADTILGNLMAEEFGMASDVVKYDGANYVQPIEYTDYCLDTQFSIDITVTQVD